MTTAKKILGAVRSLKKILWLALATVFLLGGLAGWVIAKMRLPNPPGRGLIVRQGGYKFINPVLACETADKNTFRELKPIEAALHKLIGEEVKNDQATDISMYLRMLNSGRWIGIDEEKVYAPASLLKVLVMMGYFKAAEENPNVLDHTITYRTQLADAGEAENALAGDPELGKTYSVKELIRRMIVYSNNPALNLLLDNLNETTLQTLREVYSDLNITFPQPFNKSELDFISVKTYSMVFRVLYDGTYLSKEMSERSLELLTNTEFREGLVAGLPTGVVAAHKFGARSVPVADSDQKLKELKELHDCGIVYYPRHPYLLCVMTRGYDYDDLKRTVADISRLAYTQIDPFSSTPH